MIGRFGRYFLLRGMLAAQCAGVFGNPAWVNAARCACVGLGGIWIFGKTIAVEKMESKST